MRLSLLRSNCSLVFTNHIGFVNVQAIKPAHDADNIWTIGVSVGNSPFQNSFAWLYVKKYTALEGATPTKLGPNPETMWMCGHKSFQLLF